jgi:carbamate kinase
MLAPMPFEPARPRLVVSLGDSAFGLAGAHDPSLLVDDAAHHVAPLADAWDLVITHGHGPQLGDLSDDALHAGRRVPALDLLDAELEGLLGYQLETAITRAVPQGDVATLLTRVVVRPDDPAFGHPDRPVGPVLDRDDATRLAVERGWFVRPNGAGWRRLVAAPEPVGILEQRALEVLVAAGVTVVCAGGGGIPVVIDESGVHGVSAVVDKDLAAAMVADVLQADGLLLLTDVPAVLEGFGTPAPRAIRTMSTAAARAGVWETRTIGPKIEACCRFVQHTRRWAAIGALGDAARIVDGEVGTRIVDGDAAITYWDEDRGQR